jgi:hypothetical protein
MNSDMSSKINRKLLVDIANICRYCLAFVFIYHGLFPKILYLSEIEVLLVEASGSGIPAVIASSVAGVGEILLGMLVMFYKSSKWPIYLAGFLLVFLLLYVSVVKGSLLVEAFNPVTTNIPALILCYLILRIEAKSKSIIQS